MEDKRFQVRTSEPAEKTKRSHYTDEDFEEMERLLMKIECLTELEDAFRRRRPRPFRF